MLSKPTKVLLAVVVVAAGAVHLWSRRQTIEEMPIPEDAYPPGRWTRVGPSGEDAADLTQVLSLPYLQGKVEAGETSGVTRYDPERAYRGANLYCSGHGPDAILMDMEGRTLHRWHFRFRDAFPTAKRIQESAFFRRVALLPDGDLLALFHGTGMIKLDRDSNLLWAAPVKAYNDFFIETDGRILMLHKEARVVPEVRPGEPVLEDFIAELSPDGELLGRSSLLGAFLEAPWKPLLASPSDEADILHSNTITRLAAGPAVSSADEVFAPGNLLVSLRNVDVLGVLDPSGSEVIWGRHGAWKAQHEPVLLDNGNLLLFDNKGGPDSGTRVIELEPTSGDIVWSYGEGEGEGLFSPEGGTVARLPNGNTLITASEGGRVIELGTDGEIVWEYLSPHRAGPENELVATIWEVQRIDYDELGWLP